LERDPHSLKPQFFKGEPLALKRWLRIESEEVKLGR